MTSDDGFLCQITTFSVLYIYRNSRPLYIHLFVLILNQGKMTVNEPIFVIKNYIT